MTDLVANLVARARVAQRAFEASASQELYRLAAKAAAWAIIQPERNAALAELAVATTGLGNTADKIAKNHRKTLGLVRDLMAASTHGVIRDDAATGITEIARPIGVVGAVVPSTNPGATPANNIINALACGNAIILAPSPKGADVCALLLQHVHSELAKLGLPADLVQMIPAPVDKAKTQALMKAVDLIIVTGSQDNVRRAYHSGTPALGVGAGNATIIIDETADLPAAAAKIAQSKCFDNATSCSSENVLIIVDAIRPAFLAALEAAGGMLLDAEQGKAVKSALFAGGKMNRAMIAKDLPAFLAAAGLEAAPGAKFALMEGEGIGPDFPESGEKLSLLLTHYRAADFAHAASLAEQVLRNQGAGHSVGLHSADDARARHLADHLPVCRVITNQAHAIATGGAFNNGMKFSLSMGCGSWGGNAIDDNLHHRHFVNVTKIVRPIPEHIPSLEDVFQDYWDRVGQ